MREVKEVCKKDGGCHDNLAAQGWRACSDLVRVVLQAQLPVLLLDRIFGRSDGHVQTDERVRRLPVIVAHRPLERCRRWRRRHVRLAASVLVVHARLVPLPRLLEQAFLLLRVLPLHLLDHLVVPRLELRALKLPSPPNVARIAVAAASAGAVVSAAVAGVARHVADLPRTGGWVGPRLARRTPAPWLGLSLGRALERVHDGVNRGVDGDGRGALERSSRRCVFASRSSVRKGGARGREAERQRGGARRTKASREKHARSAVRTGVRGLG